MQSLLTDKIEPALKAAVRHKELGNEALMRTEAVQALFEYTNAMAEVWKAAEALRGFLTSPLSPAEAQRLSLKQKEIDDLRVVLLCNQALAAIKLGHFSQSIDFCNTVLAFQAGNQKALFRRGFARVKLGELAAGEEDFRRILAVDPDNSEALREIRGIRRARQEPPPRVCWDSWFKACSGFRKEKSAELELTRLRN